MKRGKKYNKITKGLDRSKEYSLEEGLDVVKKLSYSSFVGSLELHIATKLPKDIDAKSVKGGISLPHSTSTKEIKIAVFTTPDRDDEAKKAGADFVGMEKLMTDVKAGKIEFDLAIATPSVMPKIAVLGKELGPKGLMPNPKIGTVTEDIASVVEEYKKGKQTFASDDSGVIHISIGKVDMENEKLIENINAVISSLESVIGKTYTQWIKRIHLAPTMGPSIKVSYSRGE